MNNIIRSIFWITVSVIFGSVVYLFNHESGCQWFTAYIIEKSLSVDNLFVMYLIFNYFNTPEKLQHKALNWGIIGVIILRVPFIVGGAVLINLFHPLVYVLGLMLIYSGIKILYSQDEEAEIHENAVVKWFKKHFGSYDNYFGSKFFLEGKATVLFIVLLMIETTDVIFALDSIPAAFGVSRNLFILLSSNIFAVIGLRALYFVLVDFIERLWALKYGISIILALIGVRMIIADFVEIPINIALLSTLFLLISTTIISLSFSPKSAKA